MPVFPSVEWFQAVADIVNQDEAYHRLGNTDAKVGIKVGDQLFALTFEAFEVTKVEEIDESRMDDLDFTLVMAPEKWREMIENIKQNGHADLHHTLNSIDLATPEEFAQSNDYYRRDLFYRFNQSFQHFFDASAKIDTQFTEPARA